MIKRITTEKEAQVCDELLTKLILDEGQYNKLLSSNFKVKDYFKNVIKNEENILLGYEICNKIIGYVYLKCIQDEDVTGYLIDGLYIKENYRLHGYAKELLEYSLSLLKTRSTSFIDINVMFNNEIAKKLYKSLGFQEFKITMRKYN